MMRNWCWWLDDDELMLDGLCMHVDCVCVIGVCAVFY
jgi:hypothetical protein